MRSIGRNLPNTMNYRQLPIYMDKGTLIKNKFMKLQSKGLQYVNNNTSDFFEAYKINGHQ